MLGEKKKKRISHTEDSQVLKSKDVSVTRAVNRAYTHHVNLCVTASHMCLCFDRVRVKRWTLFPVLRREKNTRLCKACMHTVITSGPMSQPGTSEMGKQVQTAYYHSKVQPSCCLAGYTSYRVIGPYQHVTVITFSLEKRMQTSD